MREWIMWQRGNEIIFLGKGKKVENEKKNMI